MAHVQIILRTTKMSVWVNKTIIKIYGSFWKMSWLLTLWCVGDWKISHFVHMIFYFWTQMTLFGTETCRVDKNTPLCWNVVLVFAFPVYYFQYWPLLWCIWQVLISSCPSTVSSVCTYWTHNISNNFLLFRTFSFISSALVSATQLLPEWGS